MHTHTSRLVRGGVLLVALVVSLGMFVSSTGRAEAQIDVSGEWIVTTLNSGAGDSLDTAATITQAGTRLSMAVDNWSLAGPGTFSGTIDTATGDFSLSGTVVAGDGTTSLSYDLTGTASPDGNSISGSYTRNTSGTFDGVRQLAATSPAAVAAAVPETGSGPASSGDSTGLWAALPALAAVAGAVMVAGGLLAARRRA